MLQDRDRDDRFLNYVFELTRSVDKSSLIDILGYCMSITAKLTPLTNPDKITIDEGVYDMLHPEIKSKFVEIKYESEKWKYIDRHTGRPYKLYKL